MRCGIDPGLGGALAFVTDDLKCLAVIDMPVMAYGKKQQVNGAAVSKIFKSWSGKSGDIMVYLEQAQVIGHKDGRHQGITSTANFLMGWGKIQGVLDTLEIPYKLVRPQEWKKRAGLLRQPKDMSRTLAQQLYPDVSLARKKDIGRAESLLIAHFGKE